MLESEGQSNSRNGYTSEEIERFQKAFREVLTQPRRAVELLEAAVDEINTVISARLWLLLKRKLGFVSFLHVIRSTYLLGKGTSAGDTAGFLLLPVHAY